MSQIKVKFYVTGFIVLKGELAKNSSLAFAEELALLEGAKANVPFVRLTKRNFEKCEWRAFSSVCGTYPQSKTRSV